MSVIAKGKIIEKKVFFLDQLPSITSFLDSGVSREELMMIILKKYKYDNPNVHDLYEVRKNVKFCLLLIERSPKDDLQRPEIIFHDNVIEPSIRPKVNRDYFTTIRVESDFYKKDEEYNLFCFRPMSPPLKSDIN